MDSTLFAQFLKDFTEELYHRAAGAKSRDERMAIKGVQHSLERAMIKWGINQFERAVQQNGKSADKSAGA